MLPRFGSTPSSLFSPSTLVTVRNDLQFHLNGFQLTAASSHLSLLSGWNTSRRHRSTSAAEAFCSVQHQQQSHLFTRCRCVADDVCKVRAIRPARCKPDGTRNTHARHCVKHSRKIYIRREHAGQLCRTGFRPTEKCLTKQYIRDCELRNQAENHEN